MKSNEIIQEGPITDMIPGWKTGAKVAAGIGGAMDPTKTMAGAYNAKAQEQQITALARRDSREWFKQESNLVANGIPEAKLGPYLSNWAKKFYEVPNLPDFKSSYTQPAALQYISTAIRTKQLQDAGVDNQPAAGAQQGGTAGGTQTGTGGQAGGTAGGTQGGTAGNAAPTSGNVTTTGGTTGNAAPTTGNVAAGGATTGNAAPTTGNVAAGGATTGAAQQPAADPAHALFKDPAAFKAEWDKFMASNPNFKLITDDALLSTLRDMWMRTGGLKAESKKNKGKRL